MSTIFRLSIIRHAPYQIICWRNAWYVVGHCQLGNTIRNFKVERIKNLFLTNNAFQCSSDFAGTYSFFQNLLPISNGSDMLIELLVRGSKSSNNHICDYWYLRQCVNSKWDNLVVFTVEKDVLLDQVARILLPYGNSLQIIASMSLIQKMVKKLSELMTFHQSI